MMSMSRFKKEAAKPSGSANILREFFEKPQGNYLTLVSLCELRVLALEKKSVSRKAAKPAKDDNEVFQSTLTVNCLPQPLFYLRFLCCPTA